MSAEKNKRNKISNDKLDSKYVKLNIESDFDRPNVRKFYLKSKNIEQ